MENIDHISRFVYPVQDKYVFLSTEGYTMQCMGVSPNTQVTLTETLPLYTFVYMDSSNVLHQVEVNKNLAVIYQDGTLQVEPFESISYSIKDVKFSIALAVNSAESKYEYNTPLHISENQNMGTINEENYLKLEEIWKDRLVGAINVRVYRDQNGLLAVDACIVNKGMVPDWS